MNDYRAEYQREKLAHEQAQEKLEHSSKALFQANCELYKNKQRLESEVAQKSFLLNIYRYSSEQLRLRDLLPDIAQDMMEMLRIPMCLFDYLPMNKGTGSFRSPLYSNSLLVQSSLHFPDASIEEINEIADTIAIDVLQKHEPVWSDISSNQLRGDSKILMKTLDVTAVWALPIVSNEHISSIFFMFTGRDNSNLRERVELFTSAFKQLGVLVEHRHHEEQLEYNYQRLQDTFSELQLAQKQLVQSEKLASIGQLSAGIAHEINNPIGFIKSNLTTLTGYMHVYKSTLLESKNILEIVSNSDLEISSGAMGLVDTWTKYDLEYLMNDADCLLVESLEGVGRVAEIVAGLKQFARASDDKKTSLNINQSIEDALKLASNELKYKADIQQNLGQVPNILANHGSMVQVLLNLLVNAGQAISKRGTISITTRVKDSWVELIIEDTGVGMASSVLESIFDPFYTTKPVGEGTGLGLSISYGIIEDHGGIVHVSSEPGTGTTFRLKFPEYTQ